jgi:acetyl-CoA carboxylase carboxyl transferase subunit beta
MNWLTRIKTLGDKIKRNFRKKFPSKEEIENSKWQAKNCCNSGPILKKDLEKNYYQCTNCFTTFPLPPSERFSYMFGKNNYVILDTPINNDPSLFTWEDASGKYKDKLEKTRKRTGLNSAISVAYGKLTENINAVVVASDWRYFGSSIGPDEGESILYACQKSLETSSSLIIFAQGGGMRMQLPSAVSLMQMPRTVLGLSEVKKKGIPVIVVADSVVAGGISASYAATGDFLFFEGKKTKWMFAGPRVAANASNTEPPEDFLEGSWAMSHGHGDHMIEKRKDTKDFLIKFLNIILKKDQSYIIGEENIDNINEITKFSKKTREAS